MTPSDLKQELLRHGASLQALAAALLHEGADADDAVQETMVRALRQPPSEPGPLAGWLHTVLRSIAGRMRRDRMRRRRRERVASRPEAEPSVQLLAIRRETLRSVVDAVLTLDDPYRDTVWQRFFEGQKPGAIAARSGVPLATVKSRLQRGLSQLRRRLDADRERDWRAALACAFGLERAQTACATTAAATAGVMVMGTGAKLALGGAAAVAAAAGIWFFASRAPERAATAGTDTSTAPGPIAADPGVAASDAEPGHERREVTPIPSAADARLATLRGRCIDARGTPIEGLDIELQQRSDSERQSLEALTDAEGCFELAFDPTSSCDLFVVGKGFRPIVATLKEQLPGSRTDLGDITLHKGARILGQVRDTEGSPVPDAEVVLQPEESEEHHFLRFRYLTGAFPRTDTDGSYQSEWRLLPGAYRITISSEVIEHGDRLTIPDGTAFVDHPIVVRARDDLEIIAGVVVDERGQPLAGVRIHGWRSGGGRTVYTDDSGRFRLVRQPGQSSGRVRLALSKAGYEPLRMDERIAWGREDLRLSMRAGRSLLVRVIAADGSPVEDYAVRVFPQPGSREMQSSRDYEVRSRGHHDGGVVEISGLPRGPYHVFVEPDGEDMIASTFVPVEISEHGAEKLEVRLPRVASRTVRLQLEDGAPVAGSKLQLVDSLGLPFGIESRVRSMEQWFSYTGPDKLLLLQEDTTDARGEVRLRGPAVGTLGLFALGPGHRPHAVAEVALSADEPLVVTVSRGARLVGRIRPAALAQEIRRDAGLPEKGLLEWQRKPGAGHGLPGIRLWRDRGTSHGTVYPDSADAPGIPDAEGRFAIDGAARGIWSVWLHTTGRQYDASEVATVTLREGETTNLDLDLSAWVPGEIAGLVLWNGAPLAEEMLSLAVNRGNESRQSIRADTDAEGRFKVRLRAGALRVSWPRQVEDGSSTQLRAPEVAVVAPSGHVAQTFHLSTGTLRIRVLDDAGKAVAGVPVQLFDAAGVQRHQLPATDAEGRCELEVEVERFRAEVLPRRLLDEAAQRAVWRANPGNPDPFAGVRFRLGDVAVERGKTTATTLRLPAEWAR